MGEKHKNECNEDRWSLERSAGGDRENTGGGGSVIKSFWDPVLAKSSCL